MSTGTDAAGSRPFTVRDFVSRKAENAQATQAGRGPLVVVSAYDALFARLADDSGVDAILVGDSLGNVVAGFDSTLPVTLDQMIYHGAAARRGTKRALLIVDMPFLSYQVSAERAMINCGRVMQQTGANAVKLEGAGETVIDAVRAVVGMGVPVMGHIGFTPQSVHALGGYRVQGREPDAAERLIDGALLLQDAGAFGIVLEMIPAAIAERITAATTIPTIGIGAGARCDGQVLVLADLLGLNDRFTPRFLRRYAELAEDARQAIRRFGAEVRAGDYPDADHSF
ncbi:MAG: 3-methyl-2-oxobutanoate hydroxymethyltransferase [Gemmatimonadaceae bacterium]